MSFFTRQRQSQAYTRIEEDPIVEDLVSKQKNAMNPAVVKLRNLAYDHPSSSASASASTAVKGTKAHVLESLVPLTHPTYRIVIPSTTTAVAAQSTRQPQQRQSSTATPNAEQTSRQ
ncbi:hypothetical protein BGW38_004692 [Lunasporangiospora selenospora]|uniref:Uncharacterized protein n=1 Tax=Lunasporangiospora selenospora TaxID=979761 RepID=A0A9P6FQX4_9FUNG|nr:hypothetical protein BGW38_004692 [Lunasporangiospora selenospora]